MRISDWSSDVCSSDLVTHEIACSLDLPPKTTAILGRRLDSFIGLDPIRLAWSHEQRLAGPEAGHDRGHVRPTRSEEHTSELQSLMRISYAVFCLKKKITITHTNHQTAKPQKPI